MALQNGDTLSFTGQAASESTATAVTEGSGDVIPTGRILGVRATLTDNTAGVADNVTVKVYKDDETSVASGGEELYSVEFAYNSDEETLSDMLASPIPFFEQPFLTVTPGQAGTDIDVTLYLDNGR
jgi:hypothetical protein